MLKATSFLLPYLNFGWGSEKGKGKNEHSVCIFSEKNFMKLPSEGIWELHTLFLPDAVGTLKYSFNEHLTSSRFQNIKFNFLLLSNGMTLTTANKRGTDSQASPAENINSFKIILDIVS